MNKDEKKSAFAAVMSSRAAKFKADVDAGKYLLPEECGYKMPYFDQTVVLKKGDKVKGLPGTGYPEMVVTEVYKESNGVIKFTDGNRFYRQEDFERVS